MKTTDEIRLLLDRFYEGKTTEAEECVLKNYFSSKDIAPELAFERVMFEGLVRSKTTTPNDLEHRLEQQINQWNRLELSTKRSQKLVNLRWIVGVAASITLLFVIGIGIYQQQQQKEELQYGEVINNPQDTYRHPKDAYAKTRWALKKFAQSINKGLEATQLNNENKTE
ncbi:hypothetical protein QP580_07090 [Prevotella bivia]|uniref:hypothetical protein n=1 Tax=Prevotella bivia TaxID=28125 RepID=UPI0007781367|nr:hypothetical protein [Prevotella bivia]KXU57480.1 hypothetical protein HMPREF3218_0201456 [Prevotella bivia]MDK7763208.1 hypothetical protein [Prevotella bivia]